MKSFLWFALTLWIITVLFFSGSAVLAQDTDKKETKKKTIYTLKRELSNLEEDLTGLESEIKEWEYVGDRLDHMISDIRNTEDDRKSKLEEFETEFNKFKEARVNKIDSRSHRTTRFSYCHPAFYLIENRIVSVIESSKNNNEDRTLKRFFEDKLKEPINKIRIETSFQISFYPPTTDSLAMKEIETKIEEIKKLPDPKDRLDKLLRSKKEIITTKLEDIKNEVEKKEAEINKKAVELEKRETTQARIDEKLMTFALPSFGILIICILLAPILYKNDNLQIYIFSSGLILELITVFLLTATILLLGLSEKINSEVLGTLIGGISGYVLGRSISGKKVGQNISQDESKDKDKIK